MKLNTVKSFINNVRNLKVAVIGETIIDEFVKVSYEGQSMKSICPVFKLEGKVQQQMGGALAIANHIKDFVKSVKIISNTNSEIVKTRFVDVNNHKKHIEINKFDTDNFPEIKVNTDDYDVVIVADFGHGFCEKLMINDGFHLMCQTNSNNFGFNRISKWKNHKKKTVCLDLREASLQMNTKFQFQSEKEIFELYNYEMKAENLFLTIGGAGAIYTNGKKIVKQKSYPSEIVDTIGAGDTFLAFATLSSVVSHQDISTIMQVPALAASLSTTWLANEKSVTKKNLFAYANRFIS